MYLSSISSRLILHDVKSWEYKKSNCLHDNLIRDISWSDDGKYLLQVNPKGSVEILSTGSSEIKTLQHLPICDSWSATFHREGYRHIAIGTKLGNVIIWDTKSKSISKSFPSPPQQSSVNFLSYNVKNTSLAATMQNGDTIIYGLASNVPVLTIKLAVSKSISAMKFHPDSRSLLGLATDEGHVLLRDISTNKDRVLFENVHASPVSDFTFSQINKDVMLSSGLDKIMHIYDIRLQNIVSTIRTSYTLSSIAMSVENQVALGTKNGIILIYDLRDMTSPLKILRGHDNEVRKIAFQPSHNHLSNELSLKEESDVHTPIQRNRSPNNRRASDIFFTNDSPPKHNLEPNHVVNSHADSFLALLELDKTNNDSESDINRSTYYLAETLKNLTDRQKSVTNGFINHQESEENMSKISTPITSRTAEQLLLPSPIYANNNNIDSSHNKVDVADSLTKCVLGDVQNTAGRSDDKIVQELKDFIEYSLFDVTHDNKDYFLRTLVVLTKQKLYLEKQLASMSDQMQTMVQNQNALIETVRLLSLKIDNLDIKK